MCSAKPTGSGRSHRIRPCGTRPGMDPELCGFPVRSYFPYSLMIIDDLRIYGIGSCPYKTYWSFILTLCCPAYLAFNASRRLPRSSSRSFQLVAAQDHQSLILSFGSRFRRQDPLGPETTVVYIFSDLVSETPDRHPMPLYRQWAFRQASNCRAPEP